MADSSLGSCNPLARSSACWHSDTTSVNILGLSCQQHDPVPRSQSQSFLKYSVSLSLTISTSTILNHKSTRAQCSLLESNSQKYHVFQIFSVSVHLLSNFRHLCHSLSVSRAQPHRFSLFLGSPGCRSPPAAR